MSQLKHYGLTRFCTLRTNRLIPVEFDGVKTHPVQSHHESGDEELKVIELEAKETDRALGKILKQLGI